MYRVPGTGISYANVDDNGGRVHAYNTFQNIMFPRMVYNINVASADDLAYFTPEHLHAQRRYICKFQSLETNCKSFFNRIFIPYNKRFVKKFTQPVQALWFAWRHNATKFKLVVEKHKIMIDCCKILLGCRNTYKINIPSVNDLASLDTRASTDTILIHLNRIRTGSSRHMSTSDLVICIHISIWNSNHRYAMTMTDKYNTMHNTTFE